MSLSSFVSRVIPAAVGFVTGGPIGAVSAAAATEQAKKQEKIIKQQINEANARRAKEMEFFGNTGSSIPTIQANLAASRPVVSTASSGGGFFDTVRGGLREVGGFVSDVFSSGIPQLLGYSRPPGIAQQPAVTSVTNIGAQESQGSGSIQAGVGTLLPQALGAARNLLRTPQGQLALGGGGAVIGSMFGGEGKTMRITRKMKSQARMVLNMTGGNLSAAAQILGIDENMLVMILLKRFRNDGPVVTKAALRKTKQTVRRLKNMCDMYDSLRPTATRRRTPMKRASTTTLIKN
jgi:hypothetical protein